MKLKEIKITDYNNLDSTVVGYRNPPLRISDKEGYSCISNTSDNVYRGVSFTNLVKKIEFWGNQVINGSDWYNFFNVGIKLNNTGSEVDDSWLLVNSSSTGIRWQNFPDVVVPNYSLDTWYHWTFYLDEDDCPWYDMKDEEGTLLYSGKLTEYPVIQFNSLTVVCPYQSDISYLRDISVYIEDTSSSESNEFLDKEGLTKVWEQIGKKYYSKEEINTKLSNAGIIPNTTVINMDNYVDITDTFNSLMDSTIKSGYYVVDWEPSYDGWLCLNTISSSSRILVDYILSETFVIRLFDLTSPNVSLTVPIQKNKKYRIINTINAFSHVTFIPNI